MRTEQEIQKLKGELEEAVNVDDSQEYDRVSNSENFKYMCNAMDAFDWVLGNIETNDFKSKSYLNLEQVKRNAKGE